MPDDVLEKLQNAKYFSVMDLENGFCHVPKDESSKKYIEFIIKSGLYEFNKATSEFWKSPAVFIQYINHVFQEIIKMDILDLYMDDIIIHGKTAESCLYKMAHDFKTAGPYGL